MKDWNDVNRIQYFEQKALQQDVSSIYFEMSNSAYIVYGSIKILVYVFVVLFGCILSHI